MPASTTISDLLSNPFFFSFVKVAVLIILIIYAILALIIVRQVDLMSKTLITQVSPVVKALAIIHAGVAIGLVVLAWGIL